jgi:hypothetical protein
MVDTSGFESFWETIIYGKSNARTRDEISLASAKASADIELQRQVDEIAFINAKRTQKITSEYLKSGTVILAIAVGGLILWSLARR